MAFFVGVNLRLGKTLIDALFLIIIYSLVYPKLVVITSIIFLLNTFAMYFTLKHNLETRRMFK